MDSSPGYVAKVKSEARKGAGLARSRLPIEIAVSSLAAIHPRPTVSHSQRTVPLKDVQENSDERKKLWKEFAERKAIATIIQDTGLNPAAVEIEFNAFLRFTERDLYALHRDSLDYFASLVSAMSDRKELVQSYKRLVWEYNSRGYLTNESFSKLLRLIRNIGYEEGIDAVANLNVRPPKGWNRPLCSVCGKPMSSLVADPSKGIGKAALEDTKKWKHGACIKKE